MLAFILAIATNMSGKKYPPDFPTGLSQTKTLRLENKRGHIDNDINEMV